MIENFKKYLERLKEQYENCKDESEREELSKKMSDCKELISDLERW